MNIQKQLKTYTAMALALALLFAFISPSSTAEANPDWTNTNGWIIESTQNGTVLKSQGNNGNIEHIPIQWPDNWQITVDFSSDSGEVKLVFSNNDKPQYAVGAQVKDGKARLRTWKWKSNYWDVLQQVDKASEYNDASPLTLKIRYFAGDEKILVILCQGEHEISRLNVSDITIRTIKMAKTISLCAESYTVFSNFDIMPIQKEESPMAVLLRTITPDSDGFYQAIARQAVADIIENFWQGDAETGRIRPTWNGFSDTLYDYRGVIWEAAMLLYPIYDMWEVTKDPYYLQLLSTQAKFFRENYKEEELEKASGLFNWASDDCAWNALLMLEFYSVTKDQWFIDRTIGLLDSANDRWYNGQLGGLYYKDGVDFMSMYETGIAWSWLRLWEITGQQRFYDLALRSYEGMHNRLGAGREDGLYYIEATSTWPLGSKENIHEASSSSFLTGNMCMAALSAKFYRITGEQKYLDRVYKTNEGLLKYYTIDGVLLDDRDAWTNGAFAAFYVSEVLSLPGTEKMQELIKQTAQSIVTNDRTDDGYYGGTWQGPAKGTSIWYANGSVPEQSMTTGTAVLMVTAAALLEAKVTEYTR